MGYYNFKAQGAGKGAYYLGTLESGSTMDVSAKYEEYSNLTSDNFLIVPQTNSAEKTANSSTFYIDRWQLTMGVEDNNTASYTAPTVSYEASTGQLSFSSTVACGGHGFAYDADRPSSRWGNTSPSATTNLTAKVYLVTEIEEL